MERDGMLGCRSYAVVMSLEMLEIYVCVCVCVLGGGGQRGEDGGGG